MTKNQVITYSVLLIGLFVGLQMIADIGATKFTTIAGVTMPAGTFAFALVFTVRDMIHKQLGKEYARAVVITAAILNVLMAAYFYMAIQLPAAGWWGNQTEFETILGILPRITAASIIAELISGMIDTEVYHWAAKRIPEKHQWARVLLSNGAALPIDSVVFGLVAFYGSEPLLGILAVINGQFLFKMAVTAASIPLIYMSPRVTIKTEVVALTKNRIN